MKDSPKSPLLEDLMRLYAKYGGDAFVEVARQLRDPEFVRLAVTVLERIASAVPHDLKDKFDSRRKRSRLESLVEFASQLGGNDEEKKGSLTVLAGQISSRQVFRTAKEIAKFSREHRLRVSSSPKRDSAARQLLESIAEHPSDVVKKIVSSVPQAGKQPDSSLQGWSDIILGKGREQKT